jgi:hypothetical protein
LGKSAHQQTTRKQWKCESKAFTFNSFLAIQCHVLSVVKLTSSQHKELKGWQAGGRCQVGQIAKQKMSQQAVAGHGGGCSGRVKPRYYP